MRKWIVIALLAVAAIPSYAASKDTGKTTLKDFQPAGTSNKKDKHRQQYDFLFSSLSGKDYTCRTAEKSKLKATDFPVGSAISYEIKGDKGKLKNAEGKEAECTIVRVAVTPAEAPAAPQATPK